MPVFSNPESLLTLLTDWGQKLLIALTIFIIGRLIAGLLLQIGVRLMRRAPVDPMIIRFARSVANVFLMLMVIILALNPLGIDTTSLIAILGAAGLAVGLALQDSLKNFASGVLLIVLRPFDLDDFVEVAGTSGSVEEINIFSTRLRTPDNKDVIIPNAMIYSDVITNYSANETRRVDLVMGVGYGDDLSVARKAIHAVLEADDRVLDEPAPQIAVAELADSSVNLHVRPWVKTVDYWNAHFDLTEKIKLAFDAQGISIPFPQMDVHMEKVA